MSDEMQNDAMTDEQKKQAEGTEGTVEGTDAAESTEEVA